jgi:hypothetical protein
LKKPASDPATQSVAQPVSKMGPVPVVTPPVKDDGTSQLLKWGGWTLGTGFFFALLTKTLFGGIGPQGPHTNSGWMALIITMMCLPFGFLLFLLGVLKWLRNRRSGPF